MRKKNMKLKKYGITKNKNTAYNYQFIGKNMKTNMTNEYQK